MDQGEWARQNRPPHTRIPKGIIPFGGVRGRSPWPPEAHMCGIAGIAYADGRPIDRDALEAMTDAMEHRGPDARGRRGVRRRRGAECGPGAPAAVHHRPLGAGPPAHGQRGRLGPGHVQRRDIQLSGPARRAQGGGPCLPFAHGHRGHRPRLGGVGRGLRCAAGRHVRLCRVGRAGRALPPGARPLRQETPLLFRGPGSVVLRLGVAGAHTPPCGPARGRSPGPFALSAL